MKIIDSAIMAQSMFGSQNPVAGNAFSTHMFTGAGWTGFLMNGTMPTDEAGIAQIFAQDSLASLYNACVGVSRGLLTYISQANIIHTLAQARYEPKGVSYFKTINGAQYRQLTPNRITENSHSKRTICQLFAGTVGTGATYNTETMGDGNLIVEFDTAVRLSHIYRNGTGSLIFSITAIADNNAETSLGTFTASTADSNLFIAANPQTAKRFRIKPASDSYTTMTPISLLSDSAVYSAAPSELPKWIVLAHTNTRVCGDTNYSPLIPYIAENVGLPSTFVIRSVDPTTDNILYCPKIRFANRSVG